MALQALAMPLQALVNSVQTRVNAIQTRVDSVQTLAIPFQALINSVQTRVDAIQTRVDSVQTLALAVEARINTAEALAVVSSQGTQFAQYVMERRLRCFTHRSRTIAHLQPTCHPGSAPVAPAGQRQHTLSCRAARRAAGSPITP